MSHLDGGEGRIQLLLDPLMDGFQLQHFGAASDKLKWAMKKDSDSLNWCKNSDKKKTKWMFSFH